MTCIERRDLILLYVANALDGDERAPLEAHLQTGCAQCAGALAEAQSVANHVSLTLAPVAPSAGAFAKLMAKVESPRADTPSHGQRTRRPISTTRPRWWTDWVQPLLIAAIATAVTYVAGVRYKTASLREDLADYEHKIVRRLVLQGVAPRESARADVAWDPPAATWWIDISNMPPAPAGRALVLWIARPDGSQVRATTFNTSRSGKAMLRVPLPTRVGDIGGAMITEEPAGATGAKPTGQPLLRWKP